jgi:hypothetical protein
MKFLFFFLGFLITPSCGRLWYFADDFDSALREAGWKPLRIKNRTVLAYGISVATVEGTAAAQICTRKQNNERTK